MLGVWLGLGALLCKGVWLREEHCNVRQGRVRAHSATIPHVMPRPTCSATARPVVKLPVRPRPSLLLLPGPYEGHPCSHQLHHQPADTHDAGSGPAGEGRGTGEGGGTCVWQQVMHVGGHVGWGGEGPRVWGHMGWWGEGRRGGGVLCRK